MNRLQKAIKATETRPTRFHTERGEPIPLSALRDVPASLRLRLTGATPEFPWMAPTAVSQLARLMRPDWHVLEFGSGTSTAWYAERTGRVTSLEHNAEWLAIVRRRLDARGIENAVLRHVPIGEFV